LLVRTCIEERFDDDTTWDELVGGQDKLCCTYGWTDLIRTNRNGGWFSISDSNSSLRCLDCMCFSIFGFGVDIADGWKIPRW
jgi:hypothetical protein